MKRRPGYNTFRYWTPDHQWFAAGMAKKILRGLNQQQYVVPDDLINWAWLRTLRFRQAGQLHGCGTIVAQTMADGARMMLTGRNRYSRTHYDDELPVEPEPECNPIQDLIEQDEVKYILGLLPDSDRQFIQTLYGIWRPKQSEREIAHRLGITPQGVNLRKQRILQRLRAKVA